MAANRKSAVKREDDPDGWIDHQESLPKAIFASYSHADREVVQACAKAYRALGIDLFIDRESLTAGQVASRAASINWL
jgi:hypothetical protein